MASPSPSCASSCRTASTPRARPDARAPRSASPSASARLPTCPASTPTARPSWRRAKNARPRPGRVRSAPSKALKACSTVGARVSSSAAITALALLPGALTVCSPKATRTRRRAAARPASATSPPSPPPTCAMCSMEGVRYRAMPSAATPCSPPIVLPTLRTRVSAATAICCAPVKRACSRGATSTPGVFRPCWRTRWRASRTRAASSASPASTISATIP